MGNIGETDLALMSPWFCLSITDYGCAFEFLSVYTINKPCITKKQLGSQDMPPIHFSCLCELYD
jgi:hypothetical protein